MMTPVPSPVSLHGVSLTLAALAAAAAAACSRGETSQRPEPSPADAAPAEPADGGAPLPVDVRGQKLSDLHVPDGVPPLSRAPVSPARRRRARRLNARGLRAYERGDYSAAIERYREALAADPGHILARYNLSCAYNLAGEPDKGLALLAELRAAEDCEACRRRLVRASEDADWHSMWSHPLFVEIVGVRVGEAERQAPFWSRSSGACPAGSRLTGAPPPRGHEAFCARGRVRHGPYARWHAGTNELAATGNYVDGRRDGVWKLFYPSGALRATGPYRRGERHGAWSEWYEDGVQASDGHYVGGRRDGRWSWFDERGAITRQATFSRGKKVD